MWLCFLLLFFPISVATQQNDFDKQLNELTQLLSKVGSKGQKPKLAVFKFDFGGNNSEFSSTLADELTRRLHETGMFTLVERDEDYINKVLRELKNSLSDLYDDTASAIEVGKLHKVNLMVVGSIKDVGQLLRVNARVINVETGSIEAVGQVLIQKDEVVTSLLNTRSKSEKGEPQDSKSEVVNEDRKREMVKSHAVKGWEFLTAQEYSKAEAEFKKAIGIDQTNFKHHVGLGWALFNQNKLSEAKAGFRNALALHFDSAEAHFGLGLAFEREDKLTEALKELEKAVELSPEDTNYKKALERVRTSKNK